MEALEKRRDELRDLIKRRRLQLIVHSIIYYDLNDSVWTDRQWQDAANELVILQKEYPHPIGWFDKEFKDWDGSTGYHLCQIISMRHKAYQILQYHKEGEKK